jgi:hypothetical protein
VSHAIPREEFEGHACCLRFPSRFPHLPVPSLAPGVRELPCDFPRYSTADGNKFVFSRTFAPPPLRVLVLLLLLLYRR